MIVFGIILTGKRKFRRISVENSTVIVLRIKSESYMKIKMTRKKLAILILLIIVVPIIYNKTSGLVTGVIQRQMMMMPKEVEVDNPHIE